MDAQDRRRHQRQVLDEDVLAYLDGDRLDARTGNVSQGGLFLRTTRPGEFPLGAVVALVFRDPVPPGGEVFLVARVVRHQPAPEVGVGLQWERAVTVGPAEPLRRILRRLFGFTNPVLEVRDLPDRAGRQHTHRFPRLDDWPAGRKTVVMPRAAAPSAPEPPAPEPPARVVALDPETAPSPAPLELDTSPPPPHPLPEPQPQPQPSPPRPLSPASPAESPRATVALRRTAPGESPAPAASTTSARPRGPITSEIDTRGNRQAMDLAAMLDHGGVQVPVRLRWMGVGAVGVESAWTPSDPEAEPVLRFQIPTREGPANLRCAGRVRATEPAATGRPPCLELAVGRVDEGDHPGVLVKYLRWLAQRHASGES